ncbi:hypothetical protein L7F22_024403 [Adiantum nelumboides]|nr:hypothetical protein [Adiantum nelumboides]
MALCSLLFQFIFFSLLLATSTGLQRYHPHDQAELESIAAAFGRPLDESFAPNVWPRGSECCSWQGVTCTTTTLPAASYNRVTALNLFNRELVGEFPPQVLNLAALESLSMSHMGRCPPASLPATSASCVPSTSMTTTSPALPLSLFNSSLLPALTHLDLSFNELSGSLPPSLFISSALTHLYLSYNALSGPLPKIKCINLRKLDLSSNALSGAIPEALYTQLPFLEELYLSDNSLVGSISPAIHNLSQTLQVLDLSFNLLSAPIPPELASLSNLSSLYLYCNRFGPAPFSPYFANLSNLQDLDLASNDFCSPNIPPQWSNLTSLSFLESGNTLSAPAPTLPSWLFRLPLQELILRSLRLTAHDHFCEQLKLINNTIFYLSISDNNLTSSARILECLCQVPFPELRELDLSRNPLQSPLITNPSVVLLAPSLHLLNLSWCGLSGRLTDSFFSQLAIRHNWLLDLSHNKLQGELPSFFTNTGNLSSIVVLSHNLFTGLTMVDEAVASSQSEDSSSLISLVFFSVSNNSKDFRGAVPPFLANCTSLTYVRMGNNRLTGQLPAEVLDLSHNHLDGDLQQALFDSDQNLTSLRVLLLSYNRLTGAIPASLGLSSPNLQLIGLSNNNLVGAIPPSLPLPAFKKLADSSKFPNQLTFRQKEETLSKDVLYVEITIDAKGRDAPYTYILKVLTSIDFSGNALSGHIPAQLGELTGLIYLNLSRNNLSGSIPAELSKLWALESLDLSNNSLTGSIPTELESLSKLAKFNVSFNEGLSGEIPAGTQLEDESSYVGDDDLCGIPKTNPCPNDQETAAIDAAQHDDGQRFVEWLQGWASLPGLLLGFVVGFACTLFALRANWRLYTSQLTCLMTQELASFIAG